jgi:hypothetical protein
MRKRYEFSGATRIRWAGGRSRAPSALTYALIQRSAYKVGVPGSLGCEEGSLYTPAIAANDVPNM